MPDGLHVVLSVRLPQDRLSAPVIRHLTHHAAEEVGIRPDVTADIDLALAEACANVLQHAGPGEAYEVTVSIGPEVCEISVVDVGRGFDHEHLKVAMADPTAEHGRGLALLHALMDDVQLDSVACQGTVVHLVKQLTFDEASEGRRLLAAGSETPAGR
jgi:serine/threonine-protein kinase RsbW